MEKVASITARHVANSSVNQITLVGGTSSFPGMAEVVEDFTGIPTRVAKNPVFVTPLGFAMQDLARGDGDRLEL
jgi:ethanolamine utilization protein EutJ